MIDDFKEELEKLMIANDIDMLAFVYRETEDHETDCAFINLTSDNIDCLEDSVMTCLDHVQDVEHILDDSFDDIDVD